MTTDGSLNVLLIGGWVDQAFTFVRSFARQKQINLFVADCWPNSPCGFSKVCHKFYRIPLYQDPQYLPAILDVCRREQIDVVLPVHHEDVVEVSKGKELFQEANVRLPIPAYPLIEVAVDKYKMAQIARESGVKDMKVERKQTFILSRGGADSAGGETEAGKGVTVRREGKKVGRNDPCPCGSGKKYKRCCLPKEEEARA